MGSSGSEKRRDLGGVQEIEFRVLNDWIYVRETGIRDDRVLMLCIEKEKVGGGYGVVIKSLFQICGGFE